MLTKARVLREINLEFRLSNPVGMMTPTTKSKRWFFAVPESIDTNEGWSELLHRIFWDSNALMWRREPGDRSWLVMDSFEVSPVRVREVVTWNGEADGATISAVLPWHKLHRVWELAVCWWVDDDGHYDGVDALSFSELLIYRAWDTEAASEQEVVAFIKNMWPGNADPSANIFEKRVERLRNIEMVRPPSTLTTRKRPGSSPIRSGPPGEQ